MSWICDYCFAIEQFLPSFLCKPGYLLWIDAIFIHDKYRQPMQWQYGLMLIQWHVTITRLDQITDDISDVKIISRVGLVYMLPTELGNNVGICYQGHYHSCSTVLVNSREAREMIAERIPRYISRYLLTISIRKSFPRNNFIVRMVYCTFRPLCETRLIIQ